MTSLKTFLFIGQSNMDGQGRLSEVPASVYLRWTGRPLPSPATSVLPVDDQVPGIHMWQTQMPFATEDSFTNTDFTSTTQVTLTGTTLGAVDMYEDRWCVIASGTAAQGATQVRKITANTNVLNSVITVSPVWAPQPTDGLRLSVLPTSHTLAGAQTSTVLTQSAVLPVPNDFVAADVGKWVVIISGTGAFQAAKVTAFTTTTLTVTPALGTVPAAGDGILILKAGGTQILSGLTGRFFPLNFFYGASSAYTTGYEFPNFKSMPRTAPILDTVLPFINPVPEASWQLRQYCGEDIWIIHLAISGAYISTLLGELGGGALEDFSWFDNEAHNDFHPGSTDELTTTPTFDLFDVLFTTIMTAAQAWVTANRPGDRLDVQDVFTMIGESEAQDQYRSALAGRNMQLLRDTARQRLVDDNYTTLSAEKIRWIIGGVRNTNSTWPFASAVNTGFQLLASDDVYTTFVDTSAITVNVGDAAHYDGLGQIAFGKLLADAWYAVRTREGDATRPSADRKTLAQLRDQVKKRHEGNGSSNDATNARILQFLNDSLREVYNTLGPNAWFLRRKETLTSTATSPATFTLPRSMKNLLYLESSACPGRKLVFKGVSMTDQGRQEVLLFSALTNVVAHFMTQPRDLVEDTDTVLLPNDYTELPVLLTCKRLAESAGSTAIAGYYAAEIQRLWKYIKRDCLRYARMYQEALVATDVYDPWTNSAWPSSLGFVEQ